MQKTKSNWDQRWYFSCCLLPLVLPPLRLIKENGSESAQQVKPGNVLCLHVAASCPGGEGQTWLLTVKVEWGRPLSHLGARVRARARHRDKFYFLLGHTLHAYLYWGNQLFLLTSRGGASAGSRPCTEFYFLAGLSPGQPVVHLYLRGTALTKSLALFGNPFSLAFPNKINLKRLG